MTAVVVGATLVLLALIAWDAWRRTLASRHVVADADLRRELAALRTEHDETRRRLLRAEERITERKR